MNICMWCCMYQCTHMQGPEEVPATYLSPVLADTVPEMTSFDNRGISDSIQGNTLAFPLVHFSVSTVYIWHWQLSRKSAWTLDAVVDTLAFSPIANLFLFSVTYQCFLCLSSALPLPVSVAMAHVITQEFSWPAVANTTYMVFSPWAREAHSLLSALLFSPPGSFSCLLGDWAPLDSDRAISSGSFCP